MRNKVFISHATPNDNDFTKWLSLKLISLGYEVWCDILFLDKGKDFWIEIEKTIRDDTIVFLLVTSEISVNSDGVLKELAVADKVKKKLHNDSFIIPLMIDESLSYDDLPAEIIRLNAIDFKRSWAVGLKDLFESLQKKSVPKNSPDPNRSNLLYQQIILYNKSVKYQEEVYSSNWFGIRSFPEELRFHDFERRIPNRFDIRDLEYPSIWYKKMLCTFAWEYDFISQLPETETYNGTKSIRIKTQDILAGEYNTKFITNSEAKRLIVQLINKAFEQHMKNTDCREYQMSNKTGYWLEKNKLEKDKYNKTLLVGKQKEKSWHFGISGAGKLYPFPSLMISTHIFFTTDGYSLIESNSIQHSSRRKQSKNWWNETWRQKLLAFIKYLSSNEDTFYLNVGSQEQIEVSSDPIKFISKVSYDIPANMNLEEEAEFESFDDDILVEDESEYDE